MNTCFHALQQWRCYTPHASLGWRINGSLRWLLSKCLSVHFLHLQHCLTCTSIGFQCTIQCLASGRWRWYWISFMSTQALDVGPRWVFRSLFLLHEFSSGTHPQRAFSLAAQRSSLRPSCKSSIAWCLFAPRQTIETSSYILLPFFRPSLL